MENGKIIWRISYISHINICYIHNGMGFSPEWDQNMWHIKYLDGNPNITCSSGGIYGHILHIVASVHNMKGGAIWLQISHTSFSSVGPHIYRSVYCPHQVFHERIACEHTIIISLTGAEEVLVGYILYSKHSKIKSHPGYSLAREQACSHACLYDDF